MARRDRKRRRNAAGKQRGPAPTEPHRDNVSGALDHASGDVEEFEAGLVSGAGGEPAEELSDAELAEDAEEALGRPGLTAAARPTAQQPAGQGGNRVLGFFRASWAELQRVQWPDRRQVAQATAVVLGFVIIAGAYLGLADVIAQKVIDFIL